MDKLDQKILKLLIKNARISVKEIAEHVNLTSPAVSSRIRKLETDGIIGGYTVCLHRPTNQPAIDALVSVSVQPSSRDEFLKSLDFKQEVLQCHHVTGSHSFIIKVSCQDMVTLEQLILNLQTFGQTSTQIILSTPLNRRGLDSIV